MSNFDTTQAVGQCGCRACGRFQNNNCDSCLIKIKTMNCDPNEWRNPNNGSGVSGSGSGMGSWPVKSAVDPVRSNIYNGGWLCNYEPAQVENGVLCKRQFFSAQVRPPFNYACSINAESKLKGMTLYASRHCYNSDGK